MSCSFPKSNLKSIKLNDATIIIVHIRPCYLHVAIALQLHSLIRIYL